jgi:ribonucleoside-diphosphate reductase alpha chain
MGILRVDHPDVLEFIGVKRREGQLPNFNISVAVTDSFMEAVRNDSEYALVNPRSGEVTGRLRARLVFDELVRSAWESGDPGLIFIDRINSANPTPGIGIIESTNPCGEQPLLPYEACILGSVNVSLYVREGRIDYDTLGNDIRVATRFLDNAIDVNAYPLPEVERMHKGNRKIGLGVMGWADLLILLGMPYNDKKSYGLARRLMKFVRDSAHEASVDLAEQRGPFPNFPGSVYDSLGAPAQRNATLTTIAPTGTLSLIAGCSSGIEPLFAIAYKRLVLDTELVEIHSHFVALAKEKGFYSEALMEKVMDRGTLKRIPEVPLDVRRLFRTALEIPAKDHIEMQAAFQEYTDNAVSKTINLPKRAKLSDVAEAFLMAYEKGVKGITIFRYGAKQGTLVKFSDVD